MDVESMSTDYTADARMFQNNKNGSGRAKRWPRWRSIGDSTALS